MLGANFQAIPEHKNNGLPVRPEEAGSLPRLNTQGGFMSDISLTVNGRQVRATVEDRTLLVHFLREHQGLTGTHVGCDTSQCGACVVHVDGKAVKSCSMLAAQASGSTVVTIEGIAAGADLHPVQAAFKEHHGLQCGFCTPGMIMTATDMIARHPEGLDEATVRAELEGNICRCTGYHNIVKAILAASQAMSKASKPKAKKAA
jgi:carbon-monoxide dehydrogenase small subunit